jgi:ATP-dependent Clp protease ATP-binding subunit ClpX
MTPGPPKVPPMLGDIRCSFCGKPGDKVASIVCGPTPDIAICDECVEVCTEIIAEQTSSAPTPPPAAA